MEGNIAFLRTGVLSIDEVTGINVFSLSARRLAGALATPIWINAVCNTGSLVSPKGKSGKF
jgi:hypothetical protein